jgi:hypothetical protein
MIIYKDKGGKRTQLWYERKIEITTKLMEKNYEEQVKSNTIIIERR